MRPFYNISLFNLNDLQKVTSLLSLSGLYDQFKKLLGAHEEKIEKNEEFKLKNKELNDKLRELIGEQKVPVLNWAENIKSTSS